MNRLAIIFGVLFASAPAWTAVTLTPAPQGKAAQPYRAAELDLTNNSTQVARAVWLRWQEGGPAILVPVILPGGAEKTITLPLPPLSQQQAFDIRLLAGETPDAAVVGRTTAEIAWPPDQVAAEQFRATPEQAAVAERPPFWPPSTLLAIWLLVLLSGLAFAGLLFIRSSWHRISMLIVASAACTLAVTKFLQSQPILVEKSAPGRALVVAARRTATWHNDANVVIPLYLSSRQMQKDGLLIRPRTDAEVPVSPFQARIFRLEANPNVGYSHLPLFP